tara:strand:- start:52 stop:360 length:309 start_codon:yes stop_codon:yes gene_type:complete
LSIKEVDSIATKTSTRRSVDVTFTGNFEAPSCKKKFAKPRAKVKAIKPKKNFSRRWSFNDQSCKKFVTNEGSGEEIIKLKKRKTTDTTKVPKNIEKVFVNES